MKNLAWILLTFAIAGSAALAFWAFGYAPDKLTLVVAAILIGALALLLKVCIAQTVSPE